MVGFHDLIFVCMFGKVKHIGIEDILLNLPRIIETVGLAVFAQTFGKIRIACQYKLNY